MNLFKMGRKLALKQIESSSKKAFEQGRLVFKDDSVEYTEHSGDKTIGTMTDIACIIHTNVSNNLITNTGDVRASLDGMEISIADVEKILEKIKGR